MNSRAVTDPRREGIRPGHRRDDDVFFNETILARRANRCERSIGRDVGLHPNVSQESIAHEKSRAVGVRDLGALGARPVRSNARSRMYKSPPQTMDASDGSTDPVRDRRSSAERMGRSRIPARRAPRGRDESSRKATDETTQGGIVSLACDGGVDAICAPAMANKQAYADDHDQVLAADANGVHYGVW